MVKSKNLEVQRHLLVGWCKYPDAPTHSKRPSPTLFTAVRSVAVSESGKYQWFDQSVILVL